MKEMFREGTEKTRVADDDPCDPEGIGLSPHSCHWKVEARSMVVLFQEASQRT